MHDACIWRTIFDVVNYYTSYSNCWCSLQDTTFCWCFRIKGSYLRKLCCYFFFSVCFEWFLIQLAYLLLYIGFDTTLFWCAMIWYWTVSIGINPTEYANSYDSSELLIPQCIWIALAGEMKTLFVNFVFIVFFFMFLFCFTKIVRFCMSFHVFTACLIMNGYLIQKLFLRFEYCMLLRWRCA